MKPAGKTVAYLRQMEDFLKRHLMSRQLHQAIEGDIWSGQLEDRPRRFSGLDDIENAVEDQGPGDQFEFLGPRGKATSLTQGGQALSAKKIKLAVQSKTAGRKRGLQRGTLSR